MPKTHPIIARYWSLGVALLLPVIEFSCEGIIRLFMDYEGHGQSFQSPVSHYWFTLGSCSADMRKTNGVWRSLPSC
jgi:hypothetical protein